MATGCSKALGVPRRHRALGGGGGSGRSRPSEVTVAGAAAELWCSQSQKRAGSVPDGSHARALLSPRPGGAEPWVSWSCKASRVLHFVRMFRVP